MDSRNSYLGMDAYAIKLIRFKARQLSRLPCFGSKDIEDLEQELAIDLHRRISNFDPGRASKNTFIARVVENHAASLVNMAMVPSRYSGQPAISWEETLGSGSADETAPYVTASFLSDVSGGPDVEVALDLDRCIRRLSKEQKRLCQLLPFHRPLAISKKMGWSRATFFRRVSTLRQTFREAGLETFFAAA